MKQPRSVVGYRPSVNLAVVAAAASPSRPTITRGRKASGTQEPQYPFKTPWVPLEEARVTAAALAAYNSKQKPPTGVGAFQNPFLAGSPSQVVQALPHPAVIEERNRLAREIHDTLVQEFAGILLHLEAVEGPGDTDSCSNSECLARARELAKSGLEDARRMLLGLRPKALEGASLSDALGQLARCFSCDGGISCTFRANGRSHKLSQDIENELYRVTQEALCNVRKHSRAGSVSILLSYTSAGVVLVIKDNGQGFAMKQPEPGAHGFGLPAMCERANRLGGRMDINSGKGTGTEIRMSVPLSGKAPK